MKKLWAGRFKKGTAKTAEIYSQSISFDHRLWRHDIQGSIAHAKMLAKQKIIPSKDANLIIKGLKEIYKEIEAGTFKFSQELEDIHMNIESALTARIGEAGARLHTARSRNDQVALDLRLYLREETEGLIALILDLQKEIVKAAEAHIDTIMPGYTHTQRAQPVLLSHHLLAYFNMFQRDRDRLEDSIKRLNIMPLGSCALAGTTLPIDRAYTAHLLGFHTVSSNSMDSVSDRDFVIEFLAASAVLMMHISRLAEELVLWSTGEFSLAEISDRFTTGSSIMPQKKNPDIAELMRGKTGRVYGSLMTMLTVMKALPLTYNRDMQEDKEPLFDTVDTVTLTLKVLIEMLPETRFNTKRMYDTAGLGFSTATDVADYLVKKGVPFRNAHEITGGIVRFCLEHEKELNSLSLDDFKRFSGAFEMDIFESLSPDSSVAGRTSAGSASLQSVKEQLRVIKKSLLKKTNNTLRGGVI